MTDVKGIWLYPSKRSVEIVLEPFMKNSAIDGAFPSLFSLSDGLLASAVGRCVAPVCGQGQGYGARSSGK
jgi:hypothetical protein